MRRRLRFLANSPASATAEAGPRKLAPGTLLIRDWHGTTYNVTVLDKGVLYEGKTFGSLTKVAHLITGGHRSGPVFFGLKVRSSHDQTC